MFVATVYKYHSDTFPKSHKPEGDYASFVGYTEAEAVQAALIACQSWEGRKPDLVNGGFRNYGPYQILISEVTKEVKRFTYETVNV